MQNSCKVAARNLDVLGHDRRPQHFEIDPRNPPAVRIQQRHSGNTDARLAQACGNVHALRHIGRGPAHIHGTADRAQCAAALYDGHGMTVARQPIGKGATRDARARDDHFELCHGLSLTRRCRIWHSERRST